ncbi:hypothetical protein P6P35_16220, partial [Clostridium perfringens]|nr:hypothetical protein [Clostridium perfringens]
IIFIYVCGFLIYSAIQYRPWIALASAGILLLGLPLYAINAYWGAQARRVEPVEDGEGPSGR